MLYSPDPLVYDYHLNAFSTMTDKYFINNSSDLDNAELVEEPSCCTGLLGGIVTGTDSEIPNVNGDFRSDTPLIPL